MFVLEYSEQILMINSVIANSQLHSSTDVSMGLFVLAPLMTKKMVKTSVGYGPIQFYTPNKNKKKSIGTSVTLYLYSFVHLLLTKVSV